MTSSQPNRFYGNGFRRHGFDAGVTHYFLAGALVEAEPELLADVLFGATAVMAIDSRLSAHLLGAWEAGKSSLRTAVPVAA